MGGDPGGARLSSVPTAALRLTEHHYAVIVASAYDGLPDEACGLLIGPMVDGRPTGVVTEARPCFNVDASARTYTVAPRDRLRAMRDAEARGEEVVGVWHSHTHTDAYPSTTDVRQAVDPSWYYVIVSLKHGEPTLHAYTIADARITEVPVGLQR